MQASAENVPQEPAPGDFQKAIASHDIAVTRCDTIPVVPIRTDPGLSIGLVSGSWWRFLQHSCIQTDGPRQTVDRELRLAARVRAWDKCDEIWIYQYPRRCQCQCLFTRADPVLGSASCRRLGEMPEITQPGAIFSMATAHTQHHLSKPLTPKIALKCLISGRCLRDHAGRIRRQVTTRQLQRELS